MPNRRNINMLILFLLSTTVVMSLVTVGMLQQNNEISPEQTPVQTTLTKDTSMPQPSATPKSIGPPVFHLLSLPPISKTVTILSSVGGTTSPPEGTYAQPENLVISVSTDVDYVFSGWEITVAGVTWTEQPWNPYLVVFGDCTIKPVFTYVAPPPAEIPIVQIFGETGYGFENGWNPTGYKPASRFQMLNLTGVSITKLTCYIQPNTTGVRVKMAIYSDSSGSPDALLGTSSEVTLTNAGAFEWIDFDFDSPIAVNASMNYWFALMGDNGVWLRCTATDFNSYVHNHNIYDDGFSSTYGLVEGVSATVASVYATITT
jgi:hypothetical protein